MEYKSPKEDSSKGNSKIDLHIHSTFSDGQNTPEEIIKNAILKNYNEIAIVDHVRRTTDWLDSFVIEIDRLKKIYSGKLNLYSGLEAKVINLEGDIDARPEFYAKVDLVLGAFHRIPKGQEEYLTGEEITKNKERALDYWFKGMLKLLENQNVRIIAHANAILDRHGIPVPFDLQKAIAQKAFACGKIIEINGKYKVPDAEFIDLLKSHRVKLCSGSDAHSLEEI